MDQIFTRATLLNSDAAQKLFANVCYTDYLGVSERFQDMLMSLPSETIEK
jgi:hypothetical protein